MDLDNDPFRLDPPRLPPAPDDYTGPCLIELEQHHRSGRGRWWRPKRAGYTDILTEAGVYPAAEARGLARAGDAYVVDARAALAGARERLGLFAERVEGAAVVELDVERARKLLGPINMAAVEFSVFGRVPAPATCSLEEAVAALRLVEAAPDVREPDGKGGYSTVIVCRPAPRLIAAALAARDWPSSPAGEPGDPIVVVPDADHPGHVKGLFCIRFKVGTADGEEA